jgi:hypothetical protein
VLTILDLSDLQPFADIDEAKAQAMIDDAHAQAAQAAPCLKDSTDEDVLAAAKSILRGAVLRWNDFGVASYQVQSLGPNGLQVDTGRGRSTLLWPSEINELQKLCATAADDAGIFSIDTAPYGYGVPGHAEICALNFGALYCSCGSDLTGDLYPLYEVP